MTYLPIIAAIAGALFAFYLVCCLIGAAVNGGMRRDEVLGFLLYLITFGRVVR